MTCCIGVILKIRTLYLSAIVANILLKKVKGTQQGTCESICQHALSGNSE